MAPAADTLRRRGGLRWGRARENVDDSRIQAVVTSAAFAVPTAFVFEPAGAASSGRTARESRMPSTCSPALWAECENDAVGRGVENLRGGLGPPDGGPRGSRTPAGCAPAGPDCARPGRRMGVRSTWSPGCNIIHRFISFRSLYSERNAFIMKG